ncbi:MAG: DedA family protein [Deltaproteobacteria bacterium]|nr:DedA family protein [Deltaproteobacteria bacterium]
MQQWAIEYIGAGNYWAVIVIIFAASVTEYLFPPFPGDAVVLFGAFFSGLGGFSLLMVWIVSSAGSLVGSLSLYYLFFRKGRKYFMEKERRFLSRRRLMRLERWFDRYGGAIIVLNRFMPGFRPFFFIAAGLSAMSLPSVLVYSTVSILLWNGLLTYVGYTAGTNWEQVVAVFHRYSALTAGIAVSLLAIFIVWRYFKYRT